MSPRRLFGLTKHLSRILHDLEEAGIQVEVGDDFSRYRAYRSQQLDRGPIYAMFDVTSSFVDRTNGFWICGFNSSGELIHTQAVRLLDLSGVSLAKHLSDHRHKYITPDTTPDPDLTYYSGPKALKTITGTVCYQGDFWLRARGLGGPRSQGATALLSRILLEIAMQAWDPDYFFAFVPKQLGAKGAHLRYGYCHCEPGRWLGPDQQVTEEDYLIWMDADDMANMKPQEALSVQRPAGVTSLGSLRTPVHEKDDLNVRENM
ncbi:MAG: hypothetical protein R8G34_10970 [Paracoccaceae bacterium]|nr:hypothetical protein [Paracoccaceae bacterium]